MDLQQLEQQLRAKKSLRDLADSPAGRSVLSGIDGAALAQAAQRGDTSELQRVLSQVLASPEGRALAEQVKRAVRET